MFRKKGIHIKSIEEQALKRNEKEIRNVSEKTMLRKKKYLRAWLAQGKDSDLFCFLLFFLASVNKTLWGRPIKSSFMLSSQVNAQS